MSLNDKWCKQFFPIKAGMSRQQLHKNNSRRVPLASVCVCLSVCMRMRVFVCVWVCVRVGISEESCQICIQPWPDLVSHMSAGCHGDALIKTLSFPTPLFTSLSLSTQTSPCLSLCLFLLPYPPLLSPIIYFSHSHTYTHTQSFQHTHMLLFFHWLWVYHLRSS